MDEALAVSFWEEKPMGSLVGQRRSRKKDKQLERMFGFQLKMTTQHGWPISRVLADLVTQGVELESSNSQESGAEVVTSRKRLNSICEAIPQGKCRVILDTRVSCV